jgi:hypothetical protein
MSFVSSKDNGELSPVARAYGEPSPVPEEAHFPLNTEDAKVAEPTGDHCLLIIVLRRKSNTNGLLIIPSPVIK